MRDSEDTRYIATRLASQATDSITGNPAFDQLCTAMREWIQDAGITIDDQFIAGALTALSALYLRIEKYPENSGAAMCEVAAVFSRIAEAPVQLPEDLLG